MRVITETKDLALPMDVVELGQDTLSVFVEGDVDLDEAGELRAVLADAVSSGQHRTVLVDLHQVHFLGSSGMGVLAELDGRLKGEGRQLLVRGCTHAIYRAFEVTGLTRHMDIEPG